MIEFEDGALQTFICGQDGELEAVEAIIPVLKDTNGANNLAAFAAIVEAITAVLSLVCQTRSTDPISVEATVLGEGTIDNVGTPVEVPVAPDVEYVVLEIVMPFPSYTVITRLSNSASLIEGKFGTISSGFLAAGPSPNAGQAFPVKDLKTVIEMPRGQENKVVRVSLLPQFNWRVWDSGVRTIR